MPPPRRRSILDLYRERQAALGSGVATPELPARASPAWGELADVFPGTEPPTEDIPPLFQQSRADQAQSLRDAIRARRHQRLEDFRRRPERAIAEAAERERAEELAAAEERLTSLPGLAHRITRDVPVALAHQAGRLVPPLRESAERGLATAARERGAEDEAAAFLPPWQRTVGDLITVGAEYETGARIPGLRQLLGSHIAPISAKKTIPAALARIAQRSGVDAARFGAFETGLGATQGQSLEELAERGRHGAVAGAMFGAGFGAAPEVVPLVRQAGRDVSLGVRLAAERAKRVGAEAGRTFAERLRSREGGPFPGTEVPAAEYGDVAVSRRAAEFEPIGLEGSWFSRLERAIAQAPFKKATPAQWRAYLSKGLNQAELRDARLDDFLSLRAEHAPNLAVGAAELRAAAGPPQMGEVVFGKRGRPPGELRAAISAMQDIAAQAATELHPYLGENTPSVLQRITRPEILAQDATERRRLALIQAPPNLPAEGQALVARYVDAIRQVQQLEGSLSLEGRQPKFEQYTLPGGADYREIVLQGTPHGGSTNMEANLRQLRDLMVAREWNAEDMGRVLGDLQTSDVGRAGRALAEVSHRLPPEAITLAQRVAGTTGGVERYESSHWPGIDNPVAHLRVKTRTLNGQKATFAEEYQSDIHQSGRERGYRLPPQELAALKAQHRTAAKAFQEVEQRWRDAILPAITATEPVPYAHDREVSSVMLGPIEIGRLIRSTEMPGDSWHFDGGDSGLRYGGTGVTDLDGALAEVRRMIAARSNSTQILLNALHDRAPLGATPMPAEIVRAAGVTQVNPSPVEFAFAGTNEIARATDNLERAARAVADAETGVPRLPFQRTEDWAGLLFRRHLQEAIADGSEVLAWVPGKWAYKAGGAAEMTSVPASRRQGNEKFYDEIMPRVARDYLKRLGIRGVEPQRVTVREHTSPGRAAEGTGPIEEFRDTDIRDVAGELPRGDVRDFINDVYNQLSAETALERSDLEEAVASVADEWYNRAKDDHSRRLAEDVPDDDYFREGAEDYVRRHVWGPATDAIKELQQRLLREAPTELFPGQGSAVAGEGLPLTEQMLAELADSYRRPGTTRQDRAVADFIDEIWSFIPEEPRHRVQPSELQKAIDDALEEAIENQIEHDRNNWEPDWDWIDDEASNMAAEDVQSVRSQVEERLEEFLQTGGVAPELAPPGGPGPGEAWVLPITPELREKVQGGQGLYLYERGRQPYVRPREAGFDPIAREVNQRRREIHERIGDPFATDQAPATVSERRTELQARKRRRFEDLRGKRYRSTKELARALQRFVDPKTEQLHVLLLDENGRVLSHSMDTSDELATVMPPWERRKVRESATSEPTRRPTWDPGAGRAARYLQEIRSRIDRTGATRAVIAHNHPSGAAVESLDDVGFIGGIAEDLRDRGVFVEGVVLGRGEYTALRPHERGFTIEDSPRWGMAAAEGRPRRIRDSRTAIEAANRVAAKPDRFMLLHLDNAARPVAYSYHRARAAETAGQWPAEHLRASASVHGIIVTGDEALFHRLRRTADRTAIWDIILRQGDRWVSAADVGLYAGSVGGGRPPAISRRLFSGPVTGQRPSEIAGAVAGGAVAAATGPSDQTLEERVTKGLFGAVGGSLIGGKIAEGIARRRGGRRGATSVSVEPPPGVQRDVAALERRLPPGSRAVELPEASRGIAVEGASRQRLEPPKTDIPGREPRPRAPERIVGATYTAQSGKVYDGHTHDEALRKAAAAGEVEVRDYPEIDRDEPNLQGEALEDRMGFRSSTGRVLSREQADAIAAAAEQLTPEAREARAASGRRDLDAVDITPQRPPIDPTDFHNPAKFDLDPTGEQRLADEVTRVVEQYGMAPKQRVTWEETRRIAAQLGLEIEGKGIAVGRRLTGPELLAVRNIVSANVERLETLYRELASAEGQKATAEALEPLRRQIGALEAQNGNLLQRFIPERSEAGRLLNSLKIVANRTLDPAVWLEKAKQLAGRGAETGLPEAVRLQIMELLATRDRAGLVKLMSEIRQAPWPEQIVTLWKAGLLTNPATHGVNVSSNTTMAFLEQVKDAPAALADRLMALRTHERTVAGPTRQIVAASLAGAKQGAKDALNVLRGRDPRALERYDFARETNYNNLILNAYTKAVFRSLGAEDAFFRAMALKRSLAEQATVIARREGRRGVQLRERVAELVQRPTDEMALRATHDAEVATFQDQTIAGELAATTARVLNKVGTQGTGLGELVLPFKKTPGAVATRVLEYGPLGLTLGTKRIAWDVLLKGRKDPAAQRAAAQLFGRGVTGTSAVLLGYELARRGLATGAYPANQAERNQWQQEGRQENSVLIDGAWQNVGRVAPYGNLIAVGANMHTAAKAGDPSFFDVAANVAASSLRTIADQPFLQGLQLASDAIREPEQKATRYVERLVGSVVPAGVSAMARGGDVERVRERSSGLTDPAGMVSELEARTPGLREGMPPAFDRLGTEQRTKTMRWFPWPGLSSTDQRQVEPLIREMSEAGYAIPALGRKKGEGALMYSQRQRVYGRAAKVAVEATIASAEYAAAREREAAARTLAEDLKARTPQLANRSIDEIVDTWLELQRKANPRAKTRAQLLRDAVNEVEGQVGVRRLQPAGAR